MKTRLQGTIVVMLEMLAVAFCPAAERTNSGLALAYPVAGIQIDGDLSDWPTGLPRYPITFVFHGEPPRDPKDYSADFRVGYNQAENALYIAGEVHDEDGLVTAGRSASLPKDEAVIVGIGIEIAGGSHLRLGFRQTRTNAATLLTQGDSNAVQYKPEHFDSTLRFWNGGWCYEFRINVDSLTHGRSRLCQGGKLELNVMIDDFDRGSSEEISRESGRMMCWYPGNMLRRLSGRGDLLLLGEGDPVGRLSGRVILSNRENPGTWKRLRFEPETAPGTLVRALTERDGSFEIDLPVGRYQVAVDQRNAESQLVQVAETSTATQPRLELVAPPLVGQVTKADPARVPAGRGTRRGAWRTFGVAEGLPAASVTGIVQDKKGELWLGTDGGGVVRFDGAWFSFYDLEGIFGGNRIAQVIRASDDCLWFVAPMEQPGEGVICLDRDRGHFTAYTRQDGLLNSRYELLAIDPQDRLCLKDDIGVARIDLRRGQVAQFSPADGLPNVMIRSFARSRKNCLYIGHMWSSMIGRWEGDRFTMLAKPLPDTNRLDTLETEDVNLLYEDHKGWLWVASSFRSILRRTGDEGATWKVVEGYPGYRVNQIYEDSQGRFWFGTQKGLLRFHEGKFDHFGSMTGLENESVLSILEDHEGRLWIGVEGGGLRVLDPAWTSYTSADGLDNNGITRLAEWGDRIAVGTKQGLNYVRGSAIIRSTLAISDSVTALWPSPDGDLMVVRSWPKIIGWDERPIHTNEMERLGKTLNHISGVIQDSHGQWWFAGERGLGLFDGRQVKFFSVLDGLPNMMLDCILNTRDDQLWVGTKGYGLSRKVGLTFTTYSRNNGLANDRVTALAEDHRGNIWAGTVSGLSRFNGSQCKTFTRQDGLPSDHILSLFVAANGRLWIGTAGGGLAIYDPNLELFQRLSREHGLTHDKVNAVLQDGRGDFWFGTEGGLTRYRPRTNTPAIRITAVTADGRSETGKQLTVSGRPRRVVVEFEGVSLGTHPDDMVYRCQLKGLEPTPHAVYRRQVAYENLACGTYEFQVQAVDLDLSVSPQSEKLVLVIRPDYEQMALVGGLCISVLTGLALGGITIKHRRERNQALVERARYLEEARQSSEKAKAAAETRENLALALRS
ncbi:MAG TPA: two-component regulator propeller domain-containing protein, partial [Candidatus Paceibacterota bacterium]|nr:two-component regulator propeller domain-containing protein [Candidatus Paceibacterota bacterium]